MDKKSSDKGETKMDTSTGAAPESKVGQPAELAVSKVVVHPLVLLSIVDHFNRMGKIGNQKRVVGILLGCFKAKGILDISNSFAGMSSLLLCVNFMTTVL